MDEEMIAPANATLVKDFTKQHGFGTYVLGLKGVEFNRSGNITFIGFPRSTPQKTGSFGSSIPSEVGKYAITPYRINAKKGCYFEFPVGTLDDYRNELWIFPPEFSDLNEAVKSTPLFKIFEQGLMMKAEVVQRENQMLKEQLKVLPALMQEWNSGAISDTVWEKFTALAEFAKGLNNREQFNKQPENNNKPNQTW